MANGQEGRMTTLIAVLATLITAGQLAVAYYTYRGEEKKNNRDAEKVLHDVQKDDLDENMRVAEMLLEHPHMFETPEERDLGTDIAIVLPELSLKRRILISIQNRSSKAEAANREQQSLVVAAALAPSKRVTIHYEGKSDAKKALDMVHALDAKGWIAYAEAEPNPNRQRVLYFSNQQPREAQELRDTILNAMGKSTGNEDDQKWLPVERDNDHQNSWFGVWLKPMS